MSAEVESVDFDGIHEEKFIFNDWQVISRRSHILNSKCSSDCKEKSKDELCLFCKYEEVLKLPHFPDMSFAKNLLQLKHNKGFGLEFNCLEALKCIENENDPLKVGIAEAWSQARIECKFSKKVANPFNWTFTTSYMGCLLNDNKEFIIEETDEKININKLMKKDTILFYDDVHLFEDELADNGVAKCSVKIRVMKDSFFLLLRYFLRIDNVMARIYDTRYFYEVGNNYMIREHTKREANTNVVMIPPYALLDPVQLAQHLPLVKQVNEKLKFPE